MKRILAILAVALLPLLAVAQEAPEITSLRASMSSLFLSPPSLGPRLTGTANLQVIQLKDAAGDVTSAVVDFRVNVQFPATRTVTGIEIRDFETDTVILIAPMPKPQTLQRGNIARTLDTTNAEELAAVAALVASPADYYAIVLTEEAPAGAMRGQFASLNPTLDAVNELKAMVAELEARIEKVQQAVGAR